MPSCKERSAGGHSTRQGKTMNVKEAYRMWAGQTCNKKNQNEQQHDSVKD
jgi:hypothetical protein